MKKKAVERLLTELRVNAYDCCWSITKIVGRMRLLKPVILEATVVNMKELTTSVNTVELLIAVKVVERRTEYCSDYRGIYQALTMVELTTRVNYQGNL